jgi:hypothetical protein
MNPVDSSHAEARRSNLPQENLVNNDMNVNGAFLEKEDCFGKPRLAMTIKFVI